MERLPKIMFYMQSASTIMCKMEYNLQLPKRHALTAFETSELEALPLILQNACLPITLHFSSPLSPPPPVTIRGGVSYEIRLEVA
jgi:hypothetical protein